MKELTEIQSQGNKGERQGLEQRPTHTLPLSPPGSSYRVLVGNELPLFYFLSSQKLWGNSPYHDGRLELLPLAALSHTQTHTQILLPSVLPGMNTGLKVTNAVLALPPL